MSKPLPVEFLEPIDLPLGEFLEEVFRDRDPEKESIVVVKKTAIRNGEGWTPIKFQNGKTKFSERQACFFGIATIKAGESYFRKDTVKNLYVVVIDDVGTKVPPGEIPIDPSYIISSSDGNYQYGYLLDTPTDPRLGVRFLAGLSEKGEGYQDINHIAHYVRLPMGINGKADAPEKKGDPVELLLWRPKQRFSLEQLAEAFGVDIHLKRGRPKERGATEVKPGEDPYLRAFRDADRVLGPETASGWIPILCPWSEEHSDRKDTGTAYKPFGGFRCHHGHCRSKRFDDVRGWLREQGFPVDEFDKQIPKAALSLESLTQRYIYITEVKAFWDLESRLMVDKEGVLDRHLNQMDGENAARLLLSHDACQKVDSPTYLPGQGLFIQEGGRSKCNLWTPGGIEIPEGRKGRPKDVSLYLEHLEWIYPEQRYREIFLWFARTLVIERGTKINWNLLQYAKPQGVGRDTMLYPILRLIGDDNIATITGEDLQSDFNPFALKELTVVNELDLFGEGRYKVYQKMKTMSATPPDTVSINIKWQRQYEVPKKTNFVFHTNSILSLGIPGDDRRFAVIESPRTKAEVLKVTNTPRFGEKNLFHRLHKVEYLDLEWLAGLGCYLRDCVDPELFDAKGHAPLTAAKEALQELTRSSEESWLIDLIENCPVKILSYSDLRKYVEGRQEGLSYIDHNRLRHEIENAGCRFLGRTRPPEQARLYALPGWLGKDLRDAKTAYFSSSEKEMRENFLSADGKNLHLDILD